MANWLKGQNGWPFLLQVAGLSAITYVVLMVSRRLLGKRGQAQLTAFPPGAGRERLGA